MTWQQSKYGECLKRFETLSFCRLPAITAHRSHEQYFQRTAKKKKKKSTPVQPPGGSVKHYIKDKNNIYPQLVSMKE